jgi:hypothetical protein
MQDIPMADEIQETISYLNGNVDYKTYVEKATSKEIKDLEQKLACKRFLGSKEFQGTAKTAIKAYQLSKGNKFETQQEEKTQTVLPRYRPMVPHFGTIGFVISLLLLTGYFFSYQFLGKQELNQDLAKLDKTQIQTNLQSVEQASEKPKILSSNEEGRNTPHPLENLVWEIKLGPASSNISQDTLIDTLSFKEGKFISNILSKEGFSPSKYSIRYKGEGVIVWETMQTKEDGTTVNWYGEFKGNTMKGVLSERPTTGKNQDFSFVSIKYSKEG